MIPFTFSSFSSEGLVWFCGFFFFLYFLKKTEFYNVFLEIILFKHEL